MKINENMVPARWCSIKIDTAARCLLSLARANEWCSHTHEFTRSGDRASERMSFNPSKSKNPSNSQQIQAIPSKSKQI